MRIFHNTATGKISDWVLDKDLFIYTSSLNVPYSTVDIDEVAPSNVALCQDGYRRQRQRDFDGNHKYYIKANEIIEREGWEEFIAPEI